MTQTDLLALLPLLVLGGGIVLNLLVIAVRRNYVLLAMLTLLELAAAFAALWPAAAAGARQVTTLLVMDGYARLYLGLVLAATFIVVLISFGYFARGDDEAEEYYVLLLLAALGAGILVSASHFASFFLGLEILSVSLYSLIAYRRVDRRGIEAGLKYLILAAASAGFLLFGMGLVYADQGTMDFSKLVFGEAPAGAPMHNVLLLAGLSMIVVGFGFKLAVVPFHLWTPDVYEGAPAPVTAFVATVSKGAVFALLLRFFARVGTNSYPSLVILYAAIAILSILAGNLLALRQTNVKRILAYSSIAHLGYLLVAFLAAGKQGADAATFYLVAYFVTTLGAFGVLSLLGAPGREVDMVDDFRGLFWQRPWPATILTASLFSLAGIPLTAGFVGKFYLLMAGVGSALWVMVFVLIVGSAIGLYAYLRVIITMAAQPADDAATTVLAAAPLAGSAALGALLLLLVWIGVYPGPLLDLIQLAVTRLI